ncbi:CDP-alcohol phosphatidyltransferase family protein [Actinophytocola sp.]|uniref:CDP-alcohol phosphatidyltransferase family protein n=1 Tax=Actinophytocola sp. TaxID=1872138 RepID=UPI002D80148F|nr:CDP-alcohol phosphatidyltransferase family protein [Actinophytocola sp.]HET9142370.1 CDP-alcohol phosphatidyltransferase family protein [Actinophytocola sp.]HEU5107337.1 CDP-alcohol phosphatidyltransferase family protein [Micromonosporaceae bacterium]
MARLPVRVAVAGLLAEFALLFGLHRLVGLGLAGWLAGLGYALLGGAFLAAGLRRVNAHSFGPANRITLARAVLVGGVLALVAPPGAAPQPAMVTLATVALGMDALDGWLARAIRESSPLGARFDLEVDAFLILVLSVEVAGRLGGWVLAIGAMRYAFVAAGAVLPWLRRQPPSRWSSKVVAAVQGVVLVVAAAGVLPAPVATIAVLSALAALTWSFTRDVGWLYRNRVTTPPR